MLPEIALYRPQIPPNTGNISRLAVAVGAKLSIVGKAAFSWGDKELRRAGLDHWQDLDFHHYPRFKDFCSAHTSKRILLISKGGQKDYFDHSFEPNDVLLFGNETAGLPPSLMKRPLTSLRIPMWGNVRSLNLSNSVAIVMYEAIRQGMEKGWLGNPRHDYLRTYYKREAEKSKEHD